MNLTENQRPLFNWWSFVGFSGIDSQAGDFANSLSLAFRPEGFLHQHRWSLAMGAVLFVSGLFHLTFLWLTGAAWSGPVSPRKPGLFGLSAGVTVCSIAWVVSRLTPRRSDQHLTHLLSGGLLLEVGLITLQYWRGVPSHFNRATSVDALIEAIMLGLILLVTLGVGWIAWRSNRLQPMPAADSLALRAGIWLLLLSCLLGLLVTIAGELNLAQGKSPEIWGREGVLKYPHGAVLHAIQTLPLLSALLQFFQVPHALWLLRGAVVSHLLFVAQALWQTFQGRGRMELDTPSFILLLTAGGLLLLPILAMIRGAAVLARARLSNPPPL